jgi:hypothetical protein
MGLKAARDGTSRLERRRPGRRRDPRSRQAANPHADATEEKEAARTTCRRGAAEEEATRGKKRCPRGGRRR